MSDLTLHEPMLTAPPPRLDAWIAWAALVSLALHAAALAFLLWQPLPESAEAPPPQAIEVQLVPPPEETSDPEEEAAAQAPPAAAPAGADGAAETEPAAETETPAEEKSAASRPAAEAAEATEATAAPEEAAPAETSEAAAADAAPEAAAEPQASGTSELAAAPAPEAGASAASVPGQGAIDPAKVAPIPLARPRVRALTAPSDAPGAVANADGADSVATAEGAVVAAAPEEADVATLTLGAARSAERFYLEAMLGDPRMARAREMLTTLPRDKRLAQTCNIEALAQIGYSGEGFAPDVVMAEAYALQEVIGTRLVANGAIFRSGEKWYGLAFDCTLSDDLSTVTAFTYRLGADVTEAVLKRLEKN